MPLSKQIRIWLHGLAAALISGGASGIVTSFAAIGIDPQKFNLGAGLYSTLQIGAAAGLINAVLGVAFYLKQSPLPQEEDK